MRYIEAPTDFDRPEETSLFLAGGISNAVDWQSVLVALLADTPLTLINPRRRDYPDDLAGEEAQVTWEHRHLRRASAVLFWFPSGTLTPISLYELGAMSMTRKPLFVGIHPDYAKRFNVGVQTKLARPDVTVVASLEELAAQVRAWLTQADAPQI
jgi:hypothetical protein